MWSVDVLLIEKLCEEFKLCPKYCHLQSNVSNCFHYQIKQCKGICKEEETVASYNKRVDTAIQSVTYQAESFVIHEKGRNATEKAFVLVLNGIYKGFGYLEASKKTAALTTYMDCISNMQDTRDSRRILTSYLKSNPEKLVPLDDRIILEKLNFDVLSDAFN